MSILLFGSSLNPICLHHLLIARKVMEDGSFSGCIFIPCGDAPHRNDLAPFENRLEMVKIAIKDEPGFDFNRCEGDWALEGKKSFTINTYRFMKETLKKDVTWLIGSDTLPLLPTWHDFESIKREMKFAMIFRPGKDGKLIAVSHSSDLQVKAFYGNYMGSATEVRNRIIAGKSVRWLVPDSVEKYLKEQCLYKV